MKTTPPQSSNPDVVSNIANLGAPLIVGLSLIYRISSGHWESVVFMAGLFAILAACYSGIIGLGEDDDEKHIESDESVDDAKSSSENVSG